MIFKSWLPLVCVTEQHYVSILFTRLWSVRKPCFSSTRVTWWQQKCHFFIFACRLVLNLYTHAQLRILKFEDSVYQKTEVCAQTINEWRKSKRSVVLLRRQASPKNKYFTERNSWSPWVGYWDRPDKLDPTKLWQSHLK